MSKLSHSNPLLENVLGSISECRRKFEIWAEDNLPIDADGIYYCAEETSPYELWQASWNSRDQPSKGTDNGQG